MKRLVMGLAGLVVSLVNAGRANWRRSTWFATAAIFLTCFTPGVSTAGMIYSLDDYSSDDYPLSLQNGYHVTGTITTDGTLGLIGPSNILAWTLTVLDPSNHLVGTITLADSGSSTAIGDLVTATQTAITLSGGSFASIWFIDPFHDSIYIMQESPIGRLEDLFQHEGSLIWETDILSSFSLSPDVEFAHAVTAPEPASLTLFGMGIACFGCCLWRRAVSSQAGHYVGPAILWSTVIHRPGTNHRSPYAR